MLDPGSVDIRAELRDRQERVAADRPIWLATVLRCGHLEEIRGSGRAVPDWYVHADGQRGRAIHPCSPQRPPCEKAMRARTSCVCAD